MLYGHQCVVMEWSSYFQKSLTHMSLQFLVTCESKISDIPLQNTFAVKKSQCL